MERNRPSGATPLNDPHAEIGALKLIIKELLHSLPEEKIKEFKKRTTSSLNPAYPYEGEQSNERFKANADSNRLARTLIEDVIREKNHP